MRSSIVGLLLFLAVGWTNVACAETTVDNPETTAPLHFGVMPFLKDTRLRKEFGGYAEVLAAALSVPVSFDTSPDYETFFEAVQRGAFDIVWIGPLDAAKAVAAGYNRLVRTDRDFSAIFVTNDFNTRSLTDLRNRAVGMTRPDAATTRLAKLALDASDLRGEVTTYHFADHESCFVALLNGQVSACATHHVPLTVFERARNLKLQVIFETNKIPSTVIAVHKRLPVAQQDQVVAALTTLQQSAFGQALLAETDIDEGWVEVSPDAYLSLSVRGAPARPAAVLPRDF
ncbi:MAG: phosphate/phosphite/phosphonate ABC transporter substrate-binding protein [Pseudomonadota bacterium]